MIEQILNPRILNALGWTLIHSLWQVAAVAVLLAIILLFLRKQSARLRYNIAISSLLVSFSLFLVTFCYFFWNGDAKQILVIEAQEIEVVEVLTDNELLNITESTNNSSNFTTVFYDYFNTHLPFIVTLWFLGLTLFVIRFLGGLAYIQRLKHSHHQPLSEEWEMVMNEVKTKLRIQKMVILVESSLVHVPMVLGYIKPMILMPIGAVNYLTVEEVEAIFAHELAHIKRYDYFVNLLQSIIETILFYHPAIWWISGEIRRERENCCDDLALEVTGNSLTLAKALAKLESYRMNFVHRKIHLSMTALKNKNQLLQRIQRILNEPQSNNSTLKGFFAAIILIICFFATTLDAQKEAPTPPEAPKAETVFPAPIPPTPKSPNTTGNQSMESGEIEIPDAPESPTNLAIPPVPVAPVVPVVPVTPTLPVIPVKPIQGLKPNAPKVPTAPTFGFFPNIKSKENRFENIDKIIVLKDTIIDDEVKEIILIKEVKEDNKATKEIKISIRKNGTEDKITIYENGRKLSDAEAKKYKKNLETNEIELGILELRTQGNQRRIKEEATAMAVEMRRLEKEMQAEERKMRAEQEVMLAEQQRMMAEERKRLSEEQLRLQKEMKASRAEMMKEVETMKKERIKAMKSLKAEEKRLLKETEKMQKEAKEKAKNKQKDKEGNSSTENFRTSLNGWSEAVEDLEKTIGLAGAVTTTTTSTTTVVSDEEPVVSINDNWFDEFLNVLKKDGLLDNNEEHIRIKISESFMRVNGKRLSENQARKYYQLYEKLSGTKINGEVQIRKKTKVF